MHLGAEDAPEGEVALREVILDGPCSFNGGFTKSLLSVLPRGLMFSPGLILFWEDELIGSSSH